MPRHSVRASISKPFLPLKRALTLPKADRGISSDSIHVQLARALVESSTGESDCTATSKGVASTFRSVSTPTTGCSAPSQYSPQRASPQRPRGLEPAITLAKPAHTRRRHSISIAPTYAPSAPLSPKEWPLPPSPSRSASAVDSVEAVEEPAAVTADETECTCNGITTSPSLPFASTSKETVVRRRSSKHRHAQSLGLTFPPPAQAQAQSPPQSRRLTDDEAQAACPVHGPTASKVPEGPAAPTGKGGKHMRTSSTKISPIVASRLATIRESPSIASLALDGRARPRSSSLSAIALPNLAHRAPMPAPPIVTARHHSENHSRFQSDKSRQSCVSTSKSHAESATASSVSTPAHAASPSFHPRPISGEIKVSLSSRGGGPATSYESRTFSRASSSSHAPSRMELSPVLEQFGSAEHSTLDGPGSSLAPRQSSNQLSRPAISTVPSPPRLRPLPRDETWQYIKVRTVKGPTKQDAAAGLSPSAESPSAEQAATVRSKRKQSTSASHSALNLFNRMLGHRPSPLAPANAEPTYKPKPSYIVKRSSKGSAIKQWRNSVQVPLVPEDGRGPSLDMPRSLSSSVDAWSAVLQQALCEAKGNIDISASFLDISDDTDDMQAGASDDSGIGLTSIDGVDAKDVSGQEEPFPAYLEPLISRSTSTYDRLQQRRGRQASCPADPMTPSASNLSHRQFTPPMIPDPDRGYVPLASAVRPRVTRHRNESQPTSSSSSISARSHTSSRSSSSFQRDRGGHTALWPPPSELFAPLLSHTSEGESKASLTRLGTHRPRKRHVSFASAATTYTFETTSEGLAARTRLELRPRDLNTDLEVKPWMVVVPRFVLDERGIGVRDWDRDRMEAL